MKIEKHSIRKKKERKKNQARKRTWKSISTTFEDNPFLDNSLLKKTKIPSENMFRLIPVLFHTIETRKLYQHQFYHFIGRSRKMGEFMAYKEMRLFSQFGHFFMADDYANALFQSPFFRIINFSNEEKKIYKKKPNSLSWHRDKTPRI